MNAPLHPDDGKDDESGSVSLASARLRTRELALTALVPLWAFLTACRPMSDWDIWWHLKTGRLILERGELPRTDWFTFTSASQPWIDLHWGFQLLVTGLHALGGVPLLILAKAAAVAVAVRLGWLACGTQVPVWLKAAIWTLAIWSISRRSLERPEMISFMLFALWLLILSRCERAPRLLWWLPAIQIVWVNFHGLFLLGPIVGAAFVVDRAVRQLARGRWGLEPVGRSPSWARLGAVGSLSLLASLVNPYLVDGALFPLVLYQKLSTQHAFYSKLVAEFKPFAVAVDGYLPVAGLGLLTVLSVVWLAVERRVSLLRMLLLAGFGHLLWSQLRNLTFFSLVCGYVLCLNVSQALAARARRLRPEDDAALAAEASAPTGDWEDRDLAVRARLTLAMTVVSVSLGFVNLAAPAWTGEKVRFGEVPDIYPHEAVQFAMRPGMPKRAYLAHFGLAAVYIFHADPEHKVFMDGRLEVVRYETVVLGEEIRRRMLLSSPTFEPALTDREGQPAVVILDRYFSRLAIVGLARMPNWRCVYIDRAAAVLVDAATADRLGLPAVELTLPPRTEKLVR